VLAAVTVGCAPELAVPPSELPPAGRQDINNTSRRAASAALVKTDFIFPVPPENIFIDEAESN
jgi:hypothetical protein